MASVNPSRRYSSPLREQQATATRRAIVDAAQELFLSQGYGATTLEQIAGRAGVSRQTVFTAVGNKQALLAAVRDVAIAGDHEPIPVKSRSGAAAITNEPDQARAAALIAAHLTAVARRYAPVHTIIRGTAATGEEELSRLWNDEEHQRLVGARHWIDVLAAKAPLRSDLTTGHTTDILWLLMAPDHYARLVHDRDWTPEEYQRWLTEQIQNLCGTPTPPGR